MLLACSSFAQRNVTTFGLSVKPIIPSKFFDSAEETVSEDFLTMTFTPRMGFNFGMLMRRGFTDVFSLEAGIHLVRRNYKVTTFDSDYNIEMDNKFAFIGYEIPIQGLIYVRLGDQMWMNGSGGISFDSYPSNVFSTSDTRIDTVTFDLELNTQRSSWVQVSLVANYGFEYRTKKGGWYYLGASYHRPFTDIGTTFAEYTRQTIPYDLEYNLSGSYLTIDLRYFFHEKPERKKN
jgi:hypothetical protein